MPIYDYRCRGCGNEFELIVLKGTVVECPTCQSPDLDQLLSGFSVATEELSRARVKKARARYIASKDVKDKQVAEAEDIREHMGEMPPPPPPKKS